MPLTGPLDEHGDRCDVANVGRVNVAPMAARTKADTMICGHHNQGSIPEPCRAQPFDDLPEYVVGVAQLQKVPLVIVSDVPRVLRPPEAGAVTRRRAAVCVRTPRRQILVRDVRKKCMKDMQTRLPTRSN